MTELSKLKRIIIKEEYVAITGDFVKAVILDRFIYCSKIILTDITDGWFYKTAEELSEETMLGLSVASMRTHIKALVDLNFISERNNPKYKWDRTKQYRVNLVEIVKALNEKGY